MCLLVYLLLLATIVNEEEIPMSYQSGGKNSNVSMLLHVVCVLRMLDKMYK